MRTQRLDPKEIARLLMNSGAPAYVPSVVIEIDARKGKPPCGECHLHPGETCDICGAKEPSNA